MREALSEKEEAKTLKSKARDKIRPRMGRIDIDYQKLHDAFFRWQTKPRMSVFGDLYYEGKELEAKMRDKKPGELSDDLRTALGMPLGPNAHKFPPPWLIAMQRYGPPPSYPNLKIPGLNAPIPESCSFGYHAGGWGKPPVDESGRPLYGDVFGTDVPLPQTYHYDEHIEYTPWGELESESEESEAEDEEEEDEEAGETDETGLVTPAAEGLITPSGMSSGVVTLGAETPESSIELRKKKATETEDSDRDKEPQTLYKVLPEKKVDRISGQMMASTHAYDVAGAVAGADKRPHKTAPEGIVVQLNPDEDIDLSDAVKIAEKYEQKQREQAGNRRGGGDDDFSGMVAEHNVRQREKEKRKRKAQEESKSSSTTSAKKEKFKF